MTTHPSSVSPSPPVTVDPPAPPAEASWADLLAGANGTRSLALAGGVALHAMNVYLATTILPSVVRDIGGVSLYAWNTTLFVVGSILGSASSAALLGRVGPRAAYAMAAALFAAGTAVCGLAPTMLALLVGRGLQGLGGGLVVALAYAMIRLVFRESLWPRAMALVSGMWGVATLVGPALGGVFAESGRWRLAFFVVIPATASFAVLALRILPRSAAVERPHEGVPLVPIALLASGVLAVSLGSVSPRPVWNVLGVAVGIVAMLAWRHVESGPRGRLLPRGAFRLGTKLGALYATMSLLAVTVTSSEIYAPLFLQELHRLSPLAAGYLAALMAGGWTAGSLASSGLAGRSADKVLRLAPALVALGMLTLTLTLPVPSPGGGPGLVVLAAGLVVVGLGVGIAWPHLLTRVLQSASADDMELAAASLTTVQLSATALGGALAGAIVNVSGLLEPGGEVGVSNAARALCLAFTLAPSLAIVTAGRSLIGRALPSGT